MGHFHHIILFSFLFFVDALKHNLHSPDPLLFILHDAGECYMALPAIQEMFSLGYSVQVCCRFVGFLFFSHDPFPGSRSRGASIFHLLKWIRWCSSIFLRRYWAQCIDRRRHSRCKSSGLRRRSFCLALFYASDQTYFLSNISKESSFFNFKIPRQLLDLDDVRVVVDYFSTPLVPSVVCVGMAYAMQVDTSIL